MTDSPKKGTAGYALERLANLSREFEPDTRAWGVEQDGPDAAEFTYVVDGEKWRIRAERQ